MRTNGVEAAIARYKEAGTKKYAHNSNYAGGFTVLYCTTINIRNE